MQSKKSLDKIFDSEPSLNEAQTVSLIEDISKKDDWLCYGGEWDSRMQAFVENYINSQAMTPGVLGPMYTNQPVHVGRVKSHPVYGRVDMLLYGNGAVIVQTKSVDDRTIYLWIDKHYANLFGYPMPQ